MGLAGLVACGAVLRGSAVFPGIAALWPTGCAALVLLAGTTGARHGADRLLTSRPLRHLGDLSYALYLWHWPVLVFALVVEGRAHLDAVDGAVRRRRVAAPRRRDPPPRRAAGAARCLPPRGAGWVAVGLAVVFLATAVWQGDAPAPRPGRGAGRGRPPPGGRWRWSPGRARAGPAAAPAGRRHRRLGAHRALGLHADDPLPDGRLRAAGRPPPAAADRPSSATRTPKQLAGALVPIAARHRWQLIAIVRGACPFLTASEVKGPDASAAAEIAGLRPDAVVTLGSRDVRAGLTEQTPPGFVAQWAPAG